MKVFYFKIFPNESLLFIGKIIMSRVTGEFKNV